MNSGACASPLERVRLEDTRRDALCSMQGSDGRCGLRYGTRDCQRRLHTVGLQPLRPGRTPATDEGDPPRLPCARGPPQPKYCRDLLGSASARA